MQVRMAYDVFMMSGVVQELELSESDLSLFLSAVAGHYHAHVPYHNFGHAVQVLHTVWMVSWLHVRRSCCEQLHACLVSMPLEHATCACHLVYSSSCP
jgi:hypothetical protein